MVQKARSKMTPTTSEPEDTQTVIDKDPDLEVEKRGHDTDTDDTPRKKTRRNTNPPPRSPLPKRRGRNEDPVGKRAKATKAAKTKAMKKAKAEDKQKKAAEAEAATDKLAEMEMDESFSQTQEDQQRVRRLSDMEAMTDGRHDGSSEDEFTDLSDHTNDHSEESEHEGESLADNETEQSERKHAPKKTKKALPKLRDQIAKRKAGMKGKGGTRRNKATLPPASGLSTEWLKAQKSKKNGPTEAAQYTMDDEAALSTRPDYPPSPTKFNRKAADAKLASARAAASRSTRKRTLQVVAPILEDSDDSDSEHSEPLPHATRPTIKPRAASSSRKGKRVARPADKPGNASKRRKKSTPPSDTSTASLSDSRTAIMPKGGNKLNVLPSIILSSKTKYLATLFSALDASEAPFDDFAKTSSQFLKISRQAFKSIWPHFNITLESDDVLFNVGYQRVVERRGKIYDAARASLQNHFVSQKYSRANIVKWVEWFCSTHGSPIFYEVPVPQDGEWAPRNPQYQKPHGFLKSKYMISVGVQFLRDSRDTACDFGSPRGLFVLMMTAFERVARAYKTGVYIHPGDFCAKSCNSWVKGYNNNFTKKTAEWWEETLQYYGDASELESEGVCDMSILDETRGALPMSSSP